MHRAPGIPVRPLCKRAENFRQIPGRIAPRGDRARLAHAYVGWRKAKRAHHFEPRGGWHGGHGAKGAFAPPYSPIMSLSLLTRRRNSLVDMTNKKSIKQGRSAPWKSSTMSWSAGDRPAAWWRAVSRGSETYRGLLEAGGAGNNWVVRRPWASRSWCRQANNWAFNTVPQKGLNGRIGAISRAARGSAARRAINAMVYIRGHRADYDQWAALGNAGWAFADVLPYFKRSENNGGRAR